MPISVSLLQRFHKMEAASQERFKQGKELVQRDANGKVIVPSQTDARPNIFQEAFKNVEPISASDS